MVHRYPIHRKGHHWNVLQRIATELNIPIKKISLSQEDNQWNIKLPEIDTNQKLLLDKIMQDNPSFPPSHSEEVASVKDLFECQSEIEIEIEIPFRYFLGSSDGKQFDRIELHFDHSLTKKEKEKVRNVYARLFNFLS